MIFSHEHGLEDAPLWRDSSNISTSEVPLLGGGLLPEIGDTVSSIPVCDLRLTVWWKPRDRPHFHRALIASSAKEQICSLAGRVSW